MSVIAKVRFYISGDMVRDIGIIYCSEMLKKMGLNYTLERNFLEFEYIEPSKISHYILNNFIFDIFKNSKREKLQEKFEDIESLTNDNFIERLNKLDTSSKEKDTLLKDYKNRRFPYVRNSGKYGLNTSLENMEKNLNNLVDVIIQSNLGINKMDLHNFKEQDYVCNVCNINKTTELDINFNPRVDSKYSFLFRGAEKSGFKNNGNGENNICFECEFLNLMCLLYISLERPTMLAYTNDLRELLFVNYKLMLKRRLYLDKGFYKKLIHEKINSLKLYDFEIDANKGIILKFTSVIEYKALLKKIELIDIIDKFNFAKDSVILKNLGKTMIENNSLINLKNLVLDNLIVVAKAEGSTRDIDFRSSFYNVINYINLLWKINDKEEYIMNSFKRENIVYSQVGKVLTVKMDDTKKKNFVFKVVQLLKAKDRSSLFQVIMHTLASYGVKLQAGFVEGIMQSDELELNTNIGLFIQELMIVGGNKDE